MSAIGISVPPLAATAPCPQCGAAIVDSYVGVRIDSPVAIVWHVCSLGHATEAADARLSLLDTDG